MVEDDNRSEAPRPSGDIPTHSARLTPYELAFGEPVFEQRTFPDILAEAEAHAIDPAEQDRFSFLTVGSDLLREVVPPDAPPEALEEYRALLFHAFNFWRFGKRVFLLEPVVARYLVEAPPALGPWEFALPHPSIYLQLPPNLFWASTSPETTPEPVDGIWALIVSEDDPLGEPYQRLEVLMVLGIRRERAGFSVVGFNTEVGPGIAKVWTETPGREKAGDFENILPGGEIAGLYSILTTTEVLKLLARAMWYIEHHPEDVSFEEAPDEPATETGPARASRLPFHRVSLGSGSQTPAAARQDEPG